MKQYMIQVSKKNEQAIIEFFKSNYIDNNVCLRATAHENNFFLNLFGLKDLERSIFIFSAKNNEIELIKNKLQNIKDKNCFLIKFENERDYMKNINNENDKIIITIVTAGFADVVIDIGKKCGETGATTLEGKGMGANYSSFLGMPLNSEKQIILMVSTNARYKNTMNEIKKLIVQNKKIQGICFAMPISEFIKFE